MKREFIKKITRILIFTGGLFLAALIIASILLRAYSTDIQKIIINKLNDQLNTEAGVGEIRYSLLKHFPYLSATFRSVTITGAGQKNGKSGDLLLQADEVILDMNVVDALLYKKINISRIVIQNGNIHLIRSGQGHKNWDILKKENSQEKGKKRTSPLEIRSFRAVNIRYSYEDKVKRFAIKGEIRRADWSGGWWPGSEGRFRLKHAGLNVHSKKSGEHIFPEGFTVNGHMRTGESAMHLDRVKVFWGRFPVFVSGEIRRGAGSGMKLALKADDIKVQEIMDYLQGKGIVHLKKTRMEGMVSLKGELSGEGPGLSRLSAQFHLTGENGVIFFGRYKQKMEMREWVMEGKFNYRKTSVVAFHLLPSRVQVGHAGFTAEVFWKIRDKKPTDADILLNGSMKVEDLYPWTGGAFADIVKSGNVSGKLQVRIPAGMMASDSRIRLSDLEIDGKINFKDLVLFNDSVLVIEKLKTRLSPGRDMELQEGEVLWTGNPWYMNGRVRNMMEYLEGRARAVFYTDMQGSVLDINQMLDFFRFTGEAVKSIGSPAKKRKIPRIESTFSIARLNYRDFTANNVRGVLIYDDPVVLLNKTTFAAMEGNCSGTMELTLNTDKPDLVKTYLEPKHINVRKLFESFDNFGQDFIRAENLKGYVSGDISFQAMFDEKGKILKPTVLSDSYLEISQGELIGFEPLYNLSKFIRLSELKDVRFSTLKNEIFIHDQRVVIPDMKIRSSALNLSVSGVHHFDGNFDYGIGILLSDYLGRKAKRENINNSEFGEVVEDHEGKTTLFLRYKGNSEESKVYYDKKKVKEKISGNLREEKKVLKTILQEEKKRLQNDTSGYFTAEDSLQGGKRFRVEWQEGERVKTPEKRKKDTSHKKKFNVIWEEEPDTTQKK